MWKVKGTEKGCLKCSNEGMVMFNEVVMSVVLITGEISKYHWYYTSINDIFEITLA